MSAWVEPYGDVYSYNRMRYRQASGCQSHYSTHTSKMASLPYPWELHTREVSELLGQQSLKEENIPPLLRILHSRIH